MKKEKKGKERNNQRKKWLNLEIFNESRKNK